MGTPGAWRSLLIQINIRQAHRIHSELSQRCLSCREKQQSAARTITPSLLSFGRVVGRDRRPRSIRPRRRASYWGSAWRPPRRRQMLSTAARTSADDAAGASSSADRPTQITSRCESAQLHVCARRGSDADDHRTRTVKPPANSNIIPL